MQGAIYHINKNKEAIIWLVALIALAIMDPTKQHVTLCPIGMMGFDFCPGCGLGHSIGYLFRGEWVLSWQTHPLGFFAVGMLSYRIVTIILNNYYSTKIQ